jgi:hypothetical protein
VVPNILRASSLKVGYFGGSASGMLVNRRGRLSRPRAHCHAFLKRPGTVLLFCDIVLLETAQNARLQTCELVSPVIFCMRRRWIGDAPSRV